MLASGCSLKTKRQWLGFFFDGVPGPGSETTTALRQTELAKAPVQATHLLSARRVAAPEPSLFMHVPYGDRQCGECHEGKFSQKLKGTPLQICFACHDDFLKEAKVRHAPAESGECMACHDPHQSTNQFLLGRAGPALCFERHEEKDVSKVEAHAKAGTNTCATCHAPHTADLRFLLRGPAANAPVAKVGGTR